MRKAEKWRLYRKFTIDIPGNYKKNDNVDLKFLENSRVSIKYYANRLVKVIDVLLRDGFIYTFK